MNEDLKKELQRARYEIEELALQLADMLGAALHYAGVPDEKMPQAVEAYLVAMEEVFAEQMDQEMAGYEDIVKIIDHLKRSRPDLFG